MTVQASETIIISVRPYLLIKLLLINTNNERLSNITGLVYINSVNVGITESKGGVMIFYA